MGLEIRLRLGGVALDVLGGKKKGVSFENLSERCMTECLLARKCLSPLSE